MHKRLVLILCYQSHMTELVAIVLLWITDKIIKLRALEMITSKYS